MDLIEKQFTYRGETKTLHFRELTAGEQVKLSAGYKSTVREGVSEMTLDLAFEGERGQRLLQMTLVTEDGKPIYSGLGKLQDEPASKVAGMVSIAREASAEFGRRATESGEPVG
jgi:hypothetical protein